MRRPHSPQGWLRSFVVTVFVSVIGLSLFMPGNFSQWPVATAQPTVVYKTYGMNFSPYMDGQDPNLGTQISEAQLTARLEIIADSTVWVRSFGCTHGLEKFGMVAHSLGLKAAVGAWLGRDLSANNQEIANLISAANAGQVDLAIVGSEVLLRNDLTEIQLIGYMNQVRQQIPANIPVTTADVYGKLLEHPAVIASCDVVLANYYPYWEGVSIDISIATLHRQHQQMVAAAQGKSVIVSETGWPSAGNNIGNAVPSPANASFYFLNFVSWARANNVSFFYFSALDEAWKANYEGPQGAHWGVWSKDGVLKPGMQAVFDGQTMADNWTNAGVPGGPGTPSIEFTYVPPYGSSNNLFGQMLHVNTDDYKVAVYIYVNGWWNKPTWDNRLTNIRLDGGWECDITTGINDVSATQIVAYLVPKTFIPPKMEGDQTLPATLDQNSVAKAEIVRSSSSPYIEGRVTDSNNQHINYVTISLTGSQTASTYTVGNGNYSFLNLPLGGNYTVTPSHPSYTFNPLSLTFNNFASSQTANFVALANYSISLSASPSAGGTVSGSGTFAAGSSRTVTATANPNYTFTNWTENGNVVSSSASYTFTLNGNRNLVANFNIAQSSTALRASCVLRGDFDGDGKADIAVWRPSGGVWYIINSTGSQRIQSWGTTGDIPVPADYDGDGKTDLAIYRPSTGEWYSSNSSDGTTRIQSWGLSDDVPVPGDYDGDGKADIAVWRPSSGLWFVLNSSNGSGNVQGWGTAGDIPVPGDYDGDRKSDLAVWRPSSGEWFIINGSNGSQRIQGWGTLGDLPIGGDYDGDGKADLAVFRPSTGVWYIVNSLNNSQRIQGWGTNGDIPVASDYDGDAKRDIAVWRPSSGTWYIINSLNNSQRIQGWGMLGDVPVSGALIIR